MVLREGEAGLVSNAGEMVDSMEEDFVSVLYPLCRVFCDSITLLKSCFLARSWRRPPGYEDPSVLASETVCMFFHYAIFWPYLEFYAPTIYRRNEIGYQAGLN